MHKSLKWAELKMICLALVLCVFAFSANAQQQFSFSQYMENLSIVNPAYSTFKNEGLLNFSARKQWAGVHGAPTTYLINGSFPFQNITSAAGFILMNDQIAVEHNLEFNAFFAKSIQVGTKEYLSVSLNAGMRLYKAAYTELDSNDPVARNDISETRPNIGFGVMFYSDKYFLGLSLPEMTFRSLGNASVQSNPEFKKNLYFTGGYNFDLNNGFSLKSTTLVAYTSGIPVIADISGILYTENKVGLGINYRTNNDAAGILSINVDQWHFEYSYQFNMSADNISGIGNATHEVSVAIHFGGTKKEAGSK